MFLKIMLEIKQTMSFIDVNQKAIQLLLKNGTEKFKSELLIFDIENMPKMYFVESYYAESFQKRKIAESKFCIFDIVKAKL